MIVVGFINYGKVFCFINIERPYVNLNFFQLITQLLKIYNTFEARNTKLKLVTRCGGSQIWSITRTGST